MPGSEISQQTCIAPDNTFKIQSYIKIVLFCILIFTVSLLVSRYNFLLFHSIFELAGILIVFSIAIIAYNTYNLSGNIRFTYFGISYGFVCILSSFHMLAFEGMGVFSGDTANLGMYLSMSSKYLESLSLLIIPLTYSDKFKKVFKPKNVICFFALVTVLTFIAIFYLNTFNINVLNGLEATTLKRIHEFIITAILVVTLTVLVSSKMSIYNDRLYRFIMLFLVIKIASQIFFAVYVNIHDAFNVIGHTLRLISFFCIYKALTETTLRKPIEVLFRNLSSANKELEKKTSQLQETNEQLVKENIERRQTEEMLHQSEEHYRQLIKLLPEGLFLHQNNIITYVNQAALKLLGASDYYDVVGKPVLDFVPKDLHCEIFKRIEDLYSGAGIAPLNEERFLRLDGTTVDVEVIAAPFKNNGTVSAVVIARDITDRKKTQELEKSVYLQKLLIDRALETDKMKTEFFTNMSHELRTPLNVILSTLQLLTGYLENNTVIENSRMVRHFNVMNQNGRRLLKLINNLIDITKIDSGYMKLYLCNCNIVKVVEDTTLSVTQFIESKSVSLVFDTAIEELIMACDPEKIERILLNLLSNAAKFTDPGGSIYVNVLSNENNVIISVKDTGIGIPEDKQETVFKRFSQVDRTLSRNYEGSGIGLAIVKSLVEMHGGSIRLESKYGHGSNFIIQLPVRIWENVEDKIEYRNEITSQLNAEKIKIEFSDVSSSLDSVI